MKIAALLALCAGIFFSATKAAEARRHYYHHVTAHHFGRYLALRHYRHRHRTHLAYHRHRWPIRHRDPAQSAVARVRLEDGTTVVVSSTWGDRLVGFLNEMFHIEGRLPDIGCYAAHGHMPLPWGRHPVGEACDVGQSRRNVAWRPMYRATEVAHRWGLTDGCEWRGNPDCGHVQVNRSAPAPALVAIRHRRTPDKGPTGPGELAFALVHP